MGARRQVQVPDLGDFDAVEVVDVLVQVGERIEVDTPLLTLETEKATMDVPSTAAGTVASIAVRKGDKVSTGSVVLELEVEAADEGASEGEAPGRAGGGEAAAGDGGRSRAERAAGGASAGADPHGGDAEPAAPRSAPRPDAVRGAREVPVHLPDLGDFHDVEIIDVLVAPGSRVEVDAPLVTLESEKAATDVPSPVAGTVVAVHVQKGARVDTGALLATVRAEAGEGDDGGVDPTLVQPALAPTEPTLIQPALPAVEPTVLQPALSPERAARAAAERGGRDVRGAGAAGGDRERGGAGGAASATSDAQDATAAAGPSGIDRRESPRGDRRAGPTRSEPAAGLAPVEEVGFARAHAGPSVRRLARELGVDLARVKGSGVKDRITHDDVKAWVKRTLSAGGGGAAAGGAALPRVPEVDFARFGPVEVQPLSRIQRISGPRLHASWVNVPHVTQFDEADITELEAARTRLRQKALDEGIKLTPLAFVLRAVAKTLARFPRFCASLDPAAENLVLKKYVHLGFAADTPNGLVVPVLRDANRKDVYEIARELGTLSEKARAGKLAAAEMQGGCFTVSSLGGIGGTAFTPIINAPEVAILGVSRSAMKPVYENGQFVPRLLLPLSLSYDHRVIDGADAARFTTQLAECLRDVRGLLEAVP